MFTLNMPKEKCIFKIKKLDTNCYVFPTFKIKNVIKLYNIHEVDNTDINCNNSIYTNSNNKSFRQFLAFLYLLLFSPISYCFDQLPRN